MINKNIRTVAGYYYLGLTIGMINKNEIIEWADFCLENFNAPYEIIDLSLSTNKTQDEMLEILKTIYNENELRTPLSMTLGVIYSNYSKKLITDDALFSYISNLLTQASSIGED